MDSGDSPKDSGVTAPLRPAASDRSGGAQIQGDGLLRELAVTAIRCHSAELPRDSWRFTDLIAADSLARMKARPKRKRLLVCHLHCAILEAMDVFRARAHG